MLDFRGNNSNRGNILEFGGNIVIEGTWWILGGIVVRRNDGEIVGNIVIEGTCTF
jgi:hypothetical protein